MAFARGPKIVREGLILHYDAANPKCFKGVATTNVVDNPVPTSLWTTYNYLTSSATTTLETVDNINHLKLTDVTYDSGYPRLIYNNLTSTITGTFSTSFEAKGTVGAEISLKIYQSGSTKITNTAVLTDEWVRYTFDNQNTAFILDEPYITPSTDGAIYYIRNIQIEAKENSTKFVDGTRGATVENGGGVFDLTKNGHNGELLNNPTFSSNNNGSIEFHYSGSNDSIVVADNEALNISDDLTVEFWFYARDYQTQTYSINLVRKFTDTTTANFMFYFAGSHQLNKMRVFGNAGGTWQAISPLSEVLNLNQWYHVLFTYSNGGLLYINGVSQGSLTASGILGTDSDDLRIGEELDGGISLLKLYNRALTQEEISQNFNATKSRFGL